jgi:DNA-binding NtrC family response regulator
MGQKRDSPFALLVLPPGKRRRTLLGHLKSLRLTSKAVDTCRAVRESVEADPQIDIVITQASLTDGNWCDILACMMSHGVSARAVVSSSVASKRFWSEALWRGIYDILTEPYDLLEVSRVVDGALRSADFRCGQKAFRFLIAVRAERRNVFASVAGKRNATHNWKKC